jgi:filamentous hemagglutinin family protein
MKEKQKLHFVLAAIAAGLPSGLQANPGGLTVASGTASAVASGSRLNVTASSGAVLNWQSFNIGAGETTIFQQPSATSIVFNQINNQSPSQIWGNLQANGIVVLENQSGFYFGPSAVVRAPGFVATTAALTPQDFGIGAFWQFNGPPPQARIVNYGQINAGQAGSVFLIAENIENHGTITAPGGDIGLVAGQQVLISDRPDGKGLSAQVTLPSGSVDNTGRIIADAGTIALNAQVVNQNGLIQADSVLQQNGTIELVASDDLRLGANSQILARGDDSGKSPGGSVTLKSGNDFSDDNGSQIITKGGAQGGNGGNVEISAPNILSLNSSMDALAQTAFNGGQLLLDPTEIILDTSGTGSAGTGNVTAGSSTGTLDLDVNTAFLNKNFSRITLQASDDITISPGVNWNLSTSTGLTSGLLTLQAGNNIIFGSSASTTPASIYDANNWSVNLQAGVNFTTGLVQSGAASGSGSILFNGGDNGNTTGQQTLGSSIQTSGGSITLTASRDIEVGNGCVNTVAGGNIMATALSGDVNVGYNNNGYAFNSAGYSIASVANGLSQVGGIATIGGGNVTLEAGGNVISEPIVPASAYTLSSGVYGSPGASGAYGSQPGNVTVIAGNQIFGNYLVRNGTGMLEAGVTIQHGQVTQVLNPAADIGSPTDPVSLSLVSGDWDAWAAQDLYIAEVRNPNGTFNPNKVRIGTLTPSADYPGNIAASGKVTHAPLSQAFLFDYAPNSGASFWAGNSITLGAASLPRVSSAYGTLNFNTSMTPIYPPELTLEAGAGGINVIDQAITLFPSSQGLLYVTTFNGGGLNGQFFPSPGSGFTGIFMSDSGLADWNTFASGYATTPLHLLNPNFSPYDNLVQLNIAGQINTFELTASTAATITAQSTYNFAFTGQNLSPLATTSISISGSIFYQGNLTTEPLSDPLPATLFNLSDIPTTDQLPVASLVYNAAAGTLSFIGQMAATEETYLLNPTILVLNNNGQPELDANGNPVTVTLTLSAAQQAVIEELYAASQITSLAGTGNGGLALNGPGAFNISAQSMDLGISSGINVNNITTGPLPSLLAIAPANTPGATLNVNLSAGNLEMTTTSIANGGLDGAINLDVNGQIDVGAQSGVFAKPGQARGIFTASGGNVTVTATGDVNVDGSRIATYDGGNLSVTSTTGDVNAGSGGNGSTELNAVLQLGASGNLEEFTTTPGANGGSSYGVYVYGSGLIASTIGQSSVPVGNITVSAPNGSINANVGGIEQIAFNENVGPANFIDLNAGDNIDAGNSGVIGSNIRATAGGSISGVFVGSGEVNINAVNNFSGTVVGSSSVAINAGGSVSGTIVGGDSISVSGGDITASLISGSVSTSGDSSGASVGVPASNVSTDTAKVADDASTTATKTTDQGQDDEDERRKRGAKSAMLATAIGRVTIISPNIK